MFRKLLAFPVIAFLAAAAEPVPAPKPAPDGKPTSEDFIEAKATVARNLNTPFFRQHKSSYSWHIGEDEEGNLEDTIDQSIDAEDLLRVEHSAKCISTHQGEHEMNFCDAIATANGVKLNIHGGMPAYASKLEITIDRKGDFKCAFHAVYPADSGPLHWKITKKELKLKSLQFIGGSRVFGWISVTFDETTVEAKVTRSYKIEGYFKPVLQHAVPVGEPEKQK